MNSQIHTRMSARLESENQPLWFRNQHYPRNCEFLQFQETDRCKEYLTVSFTSCKGKCSLICTFIIVLKFFFYYLFKQLQFLHLFPLPFRAHCMCQPSTLPERLFLGVVVVVLFFWLKQVANIRNNASSSPYALYFLQSFSCQSHLLQVSYFY